MHDIIIKIVETKIQVADVFRELRKNKTSLTGVIMILLLMFIAVFAPFIVPHDPIKQNLTDSLLPPSIEYPFGTDHLGRCILSRSIYGARISLEIGVIVVGVTAVVGIIIGLIAGYYGGIVDEITMRIVDVMLAFPAIILALVIAGALGPGILNVVLALTIVGWVSYTRLVRGSVLSIKEKEFVESSKAIGATDFHIIIYHILPNVIAPIMVMATLGVGHVILSAAALSFLGLGAQPPMPEWGAMLNDGRAFMRTASHLTTFPGVAIMVTVLAFNLLGDGLRDALDPRMKERIIEK